MLTTRDEILDRVRANAPTLRRLGARRLRLFGSAARPGAGEPGDLDFLVDLDPKTFDAYMDVKACLESLFGRRIDLVIADAVKPALRDTLLQKPLSGKIDLSALDGLAGEVAETGESVEKPSPETQTETVVYTIGHSNHPIEKFIGLLRQHGITAVADVRSAPYSRHHPQFNTKSLAASLEKAGIAYVFLGEELGARPQDPACYDKGHVDFGRLAAREQFKRGVDRVLRGSEKYRLALMCAEKEPLDCHRTILVCRYLGQRGVRIKHILANGSIEDHRQTEARLLKATRLEPTLFAPGRGDSQALERAYARRAEEIAYKPEQEEAGHERG